jgi:prenylcysteine oxidase/farnesylcysteine lyase
MSTMETETVASRNVVDLLLKEEFNSSICPPSTAAAPDGESVQTKLDTTMPPTKVSEDFVLGFDC